MTRSASARSRPATARLALGVDIGGTFTDLALLDRASGRLHVGKVLTDYADLAAGVTAGVRQLIEGSGVAADTIRQVVHGTTLATNALIERRGARTALIVTRGFRDLLEMGRESRFDIYDIEIVLPAPLVPRRDVLEVGERLDPAGAVIQALDEAEVRALARELRERKVESLAVCLLHAYRNPAHERAVAAVLASELPGVPISLSSDVVPDIREYERASTTVANAFVQPAVGRYLGRLAGELAADGLAAPLHIMASDGGTISADVAQRFPVRIVESGPAGGAIASAHFSRAAGVADVIGFDMGGTTAKFCVIAGGEPERSTAFEVGRVYRFAKGSGLPLKVPVIEMIEIGAGGGSIAGVGPLGLLQVGPESAGAVPGPACYGLGGDKPTVTDADLVLGLIGPDSFLGGRLTLDRARAEAAIARHVAEPLGLSLLRAAAGIHEIVNEHMARAAKVHCMERGKDARDFTLFAYGGAGPVHGYRLAEALGIARVLFPLRAGVMSALGFLVAPRTFELVQASATPLEGADLGRINALLADMEAEGRRLVATADVAPADVAVRREAAMRYAGQSFELRVEAPEGALTDGHLQALRERFLAGYRLRYRRLNADVPVEIVAWRVVARGPRPEVRLVADGAAGQGRRARKGTRKVWLSAREGIADCVVYDRMALEPDDVVEGPAVVEEAESTAFVGSGSRGVVDGSGNLLVTLPDPGKGARA